MKIMVLDIGGTSIKAAVCEQGNLTDIREFPAEAKKGGPYLVGHICQIIQEYRTRHSLSRIGISTAGQVDPCLGQIIYANNNIPGYTGTCLKDIMQERFGLPTEVENDVNAAAIGEAVYGAGKEHTDFVCLTYGTGVGGAIYARGKLYGGSSHSAGEFGAMVMHPKARCPREDMFSGCYEKYASATALVDRAMAYDETLTDGRRIFARLEEPQIKRLVDEWILEIVYGLVTVVHMLNPACVILGGGVMEQPYVLEQVKANFYENIMPSFRHVKLEKAMLGNYAGMMGASVLHEIRKEEEKK
jgi:predicted NBD/HSP70 family sugar kinase